MNPRIKEIADKVGIFEHFNINTTNSEDAKKLENFAALVLAECFMQIDVVQKELDKGDCTKEALGASWVGYAIEKHFKA